MASWLRAAEELFEVVDRTAKQVVGDAIISPGAVDAGPARKLPPSATRNKVGSQRSPTFGSISPNPPRAVNTMDGNSMGYSQRLPRHASGLSREEPQSSVAPDDRPGSSRPGGEVAASESAVEATDTLEAGSTNDFSASVPEREPFKLPGFSEEYGQTGLTNTDGPSEEFSHDNEVQQKAVVDQNIAVLPMSQETGASDDQADLLKGQLEVFHLDLVSDSVEHEARPDKVAPVNVRIETNSPLEAGGLVQEVGVCKAAIENVSNLEKQLPLPSEHGLESALKVEDQLEEARGLLASDVSTGASREARLARVCTGLSNRLQEYKVENAQLEELLQAERAEKSEYNSIIKQLQQDLLSALTAAAAGESEMAGALALKNSEIESLKTSLDALNRQATLAEGKLATLQANADAVAKNCDITESRIIQALRGELGFAERRAEEEHIAHNATRMAAVARETELEQQMAESTTALMRMQATVDERTQRAANLEQKLAMLEVDCATLNQELQEMEARFKREQKRPSEDAAQSLHAWRDEAERARQAQREAESKLVSKEAETQKLRVELASIKQDIDHSSSQAHAELEKRFRELTELLYLKQTQLEQMSSEKAAAVLQLEKESRRFREAKAEVERTKNLRLAVNGDDDDHALRSFEFPFSGSLGLYQRRLGPSIQTAAKLLDFGAVTAGRFLWRRPLARLAVVFYVFFVHLFLMYLLHRLQVQADRSLSVKEYEAAVAAGLTRHNM